MSEFQIQSQTFPSLEEQFDSFQCQLYPLQPQVQEFTDWNVNQLEQNVPQHQSTQLVRPEGKYYLIMCQGRVTPIATKDDLKEALVHIIDMYAYHFEEKLQKFTWYLCQTYPSGMSVQIAEQLWQYMLGEKEEKFLQFQMIQTALLHILPPRANKKRQKWGDVFRSTPF